MIHTLYRLPIQKLSKLGLSADEMIILSIVNSYTSKDGGICKMSSQSFAEHLNCSSKKVERTITKLITNNLLIKISGKYETSKKQEANQYVLTNKSKKAFSIDKMSKPSIDKMSKNTSSKEDEYTLEMKNVFKTHPSLEKDYLKEIKEFGKEYATKRLQQKVQILKLTQIK